jgi:metal-responsive CopG/Arc/MetJ family transcriptional regulator
MDNVMKEPLTGRLTVLGRRSVLEELERRAERDGHSLSDEVRAAIRRYIEEPQHG